MKVILFLIGLFYCSVVYSQELNVLKFYCDESDLEAVVHKVKDGNNESCALIKVGLALPDVTFEGDIVGTPQYEAGEYKVYVIAEATYLNIKHQDYTPLRYDFPKDINISGEKTYIMSIEKPAIIDNGPTGTMVINSNVNGAYVYIDDEKMGITPFTYEGKDGLHSVLLKADGYNDEKAMIMVEVGQKLSHTITMKQQGCLSVNGISYEMVSVGGGSFMMGSKKDGGYKGFNYEQPLHEVELKKFSIGRTEVTQALWEEVMGNNPSEQKGANYPVTNISWNDCQEFIQKLNTLKGTNFRLPTEAEWEYAARGRGRNEGDEYSGGNNEKKVACCEGFLQEVGSKQANVLGLYDMSGNVAEWCQDWLGKYSPIKAINPDGPKMGVKKIIRGGDYTNNDETKKWYLRNAYRGHQKPSEGSPYIGFRLAKDL